LETTVLSGRVGTGKEVVAVHPPRVPAPRRAVRRDPSALRCPTTSSNRFFGYERGVHRNPHEQAGPHRAGRGWRLFLDEVARRPPRQAKLQRVLQEREFQRLGGTRVTKADIRLLAATNRDHKGAIARGEFREDLYYRLSVFEIRLPSLRERRDDILLLARGFLDEIGRAIGRPSAGLSEESQGALLAHAWPGNVRELRNAIERAVIAARRRHERAPPAWRPRRLLLPPARRVSRPEAWTSRRSKSGS
jgi:two-component system response regulator FlrC